jgi:hypothetical protein
MARRKAQTYGSAILADHGGRLSARQSRRLLRYTPGPALVRSVTLERVDRSFSQLLAGTPSGPGGSPGAARVLMLRARARRRRTPSRLTNAS